MLFVVQGIKTSKKKSIETIWLLDITDREKKSFIYTFLLSTSIFVRKAEVGIEEIFVLLSRGA